ncbi:MAG TPA: outer membrane protein assembly factor BamE [Chthoniobacterales bacterium]|nr:outer membrane protein assembly factor BamE [Chthoniobacterales bacterium]
MTDTRMGQKIARSLVILSCFAILLSLAGCDRNPLSGSRLTKANYDQIKLGMSKAQVEHILGPPTTMESKDMIIFRKTTYKYEDGKKFAIIDFKNDEVEGKDANLDK